MKSSALLVLSSLILGGHPLQAKGLGELSDKSPEVTPPANSGDAAKKDGDQAAEDKGEEAASEDAEAGAKEAAPTPTLSKDLYLAVSYGWAKAAVNGKGSWRSGGMSDLSLGYRVSGGEKSGIFLTYRYAPVAVSGTASGHSYRGVWEPHYLGGKYQWLLGSSMAVSGTGEIGYLNNSLHPVDGLPGDTKLAKSGAMAAAGAGFDWLCLEQHALAFGPRLYLAAGVAQTVQMALNVGMSL